MTYSTQEKTDATANIVCVPILGEQKEDMDTGICAKTCTPSPMHRQSCMSPMADRRHIEEIAGTTDKRKMHAGGLMMGEGSIDVLPKTLKMGTQFTPQEKVDGLGIQSGFGHPTVVSTGGILNRKAPSLEEVIS